MTRPNSQAQDGDVRGASPDGVPVVAVAASAGGVEALKRFVAALPPDLPAAVLVALHLPRDGHSMLAQILARACPLPVDVGRHGAALRRGQVLAGPTDSHLLVRDGRVVLGHGPSENGHRPSHDAMLRSVALEAGPRAVGVVLTGLLDDGAAGLVAVDRYGGGCLVQDPAQADFSSMPRAALAAVPSARRLSLDEIALEVSRMVSEPPPAAPEVDETQRRLDVVEVGSAEHGTPLMEDGSTPGQPSPFGCPDCHGVLNQVPDDVVLRFRCRTGHAWTSTSLAAQLEQQVEESLWVALRVLEERADLSRRLADEARGGSRDWSSEHFARRADEAGRSVALIRRVLKQELAGSDGAGS